MGRPTKICQDHVDFLNEYISEIESKFEKFQKKSSEPIELPTYSGLLRFWRKKNKDLRINKDTICEWKNKWKEKDADEIFVNFSESLDELLSLQEEMLLNWGIAMKYSAVITKLMLNVNHWMKETNIQENKHSGSVDLGWFFETPKEKENILWANN